MRLGDRQTAGATSLRRCLPPVRNGRVTPFSRICVIQSGHWRCQKLLPSTTHSLADFSTSSSTLLLQLPLALLPPPSAVLLRQITLVDIFTSLTHSQPVQANPPNMQFKQVVAAIFGTAAIVSASAVQERAVGKSTLPMSLVPNATLTRSSCRCRYYGDLYDPGNSATGHPRRGR